MPYDPKLDDPRIAATLETEIVAPLQKAAKLGFEWLTGGEDATVLKILAREEGEGSDLDELARATEKSNPKAAVFPKEAPTLPQGRARCEFCGGTGAVLDEQGRPVLCRCQEEKNAP